LIADEDMKPITVCPGMPKVYPSADHVLNGISIPKPSRVACFSPEEWESFTEEWASSLTYSYARVRRCGGAGDQGLDIVGFLTDATWGEGWDNYQCKRYNTPLYPSHIWVEIGKIIYYSYKGEYPPPRKCYFIASKGVGTALQKLLGNPEKLKEEAQAKWKDHCQKGITETANLPLEGELLDWFNEFDFSIFSEKSVLELINGHAKTPYHSVRFGGGLPLRPEVTPPPKEHNVEESNYIRQLFKAYSDHKGIPVNDISDLSSSLNKDFLLQRERFYNAESLRNFARDTVPDGTFNSLQEEVYYGVTDICDNSHADGLVRMRATVAQAANLSISANPLTSVVRVQDKQGICHQLANEYKLIWVPTDGEVQDDITVQ
jgi:hypothetical protein